MPGFTPALSIPYPLYGETTDIPADLTSMAGAIDDQLQTYLGFISDVQSKPSASWSANTNFPIDPSLDNVLLFNTVDFDNDGMTALMVDDASLTVRTRGVYVFTAYVAWQTPTTGNRMLQIIRNGDRVETIAGKTTSSVGAAGIALRLATVGAAFCDVGDKITAHVFQTSTAETFATSRKFAGMRVA